MFFISFLIIQIQKTYFGSNVFLKGGNYIHNVAYPECIKKRFIYFFPLIIGYLALSVEHSQFLEFNF